MLSFWEKEHLLGYDFIVVGAGLVGLSTALSLRERDARSSILVLERGLLPTGASTRNAGFACTGSPTEILDDLESQPASAVVELVAMRIRGLSRLRSRLGDAAIGYEDSGSYELLFEDRMPVLEQLEELNELLAGTIGGRAFSKVEQPAGFGFSPAVKALVQCHGEGSLNAGMMMRAMLETCASKRIEVRSGCEVQALDEGAGTVCVQVRAADGGSIPFTASAVAVCTNAFAAQLMPDTDLVPGRGQVLLTKPLANPPFRGIFHFDRGYYYFRSLGDRVLFGGGRQLDFATERTLEFGSNERILNDLREKLNDLVLPNTPWEMDMQWSGIMAFGASKRPAVRRISGRIAAGVGMGGMGVAVGSEIGDQLAALLIGK